MKKTKTRFHVASVCFGAICLINPFLHGVLHGNEEEVAMRPVLPKPQPTVLRTLEDESSAYKQLKELQEGVQTGQLQDNDLLMAYKKIQLLCTGRDDLSRAGAPIYASLTTISPEYLPFATKQAGLLPKQTAWKANNLHKLPTNNWLQQLPDFPMRTGCCNTTGRYRVSWAPDRNGILFQTPLRFLYHGDSHNDAHGWIESIMDHGFIIACTESKETLEVGFEPEETGNLLRRVKGSLATIALCQGSVFQQASFSNGRPTIFLPKQRVVSLSRQELAGNVVKYRAETDQRIFVVYGHEDLNLDFSKESSSWRTLTPYTGHVQVACLPRHSEMVKAEEKELDHHANRVIVYAQGNLLPEGKVQLLYLCEDLKGEPTTLSPLVALKPHHVETLEPSTIVEKAQGSSRSLYGNLENYSGCLFTFQLDSNQAQIAALPSHPNKAALSKASVEKEILDSGLLKRTLSETVKEIPPQTVYEGGKSLYKIALTLALAEKCLQIAGKDQPTIVETLNPLYQHLCKGVENIWSLFVFDAPWGSIVPKGDDYGAHAQMHDHIVQYGFTLYALTLLKAYEDQYRSVSQRFLPKIASASGYQNYTNAQMGDLLAADIGELSEQGYFVPTRNLDLYNGHSWLSGIGGPSVDGNNIESQSEAVLGAMAVAAWLEQTQRSPLLVGAAKTRLALEMQGLHRYFHIGDPQKSPYAHVSLEYAEKHPVISLLWDNKRCAETYWGLQWDRILACELMPAGVNLMHNYLAGSPAFSKRIAQYIIAHWKQFDTSNKIQSVLIPIVAAYDPKQARSYIADVAARRAFDIATNQFIITVATLYAEENPLRE